MTARLIPSSFTSAILLAAGVSRRMGTLKALLDWQGRFLIIHQIVALREAGADEVVVVLGHRADELQARIGVNSDVYALGNVRCVVNPDYAQGKTTSIKTGLRAISAADDSAGPILFLNVDQPRSPGIVRRVLEAHRGRRWRLDHHTHLQRQGGPSHRCQSRAVRRTAGHHRGYPGNARRDGAAPGCNTAG